jgi:diguanylate cyclase (GGDEF)-like protein/PAS domain S-box-containing protein
MDGAGGGARLGCVKGNPRRSKAPARPPPGRGSISSGDATVSSDAQHLFRLTFERGALGQLIVDYRTFRINVVNAAFCAMTGFSVDELVGQGIAMIFPADHDPSANTVERLADGTSDGYLVERTLQRRDGSTLPVMSTVSAVRDEAGTPITLLVVLRDLTNQVKAERTQRRSQALIDAAVAALPVAFSTFDANLRLTFVASGSQPGGLLEDEYLGRHISELTDNPETILALERALAGSESTSRTLMNGNTYLGLNAPMRDAAGVIVGVISVSSDISAEVAAEANRRRAEELRLFAARHDALTGLPGRSALVEHLTHLAAGEDSVGALLLLDLDDFYLINESLGYTVGDAVLIEVASRIADVFPGLMVARHGGDKFAVVAPYVVNEAEASKAAERVRIELDRDVEIGHHVLRVTASIGIAIEQARGSSSTLMRKADLAMTRAKHAGRCEYRLYDADMRRQVQQQLGIQEGLRLALDAGELQIAYQPIVNLASRRIVGAEALLRWTHATRGSVPPIDFIPIAEKSGLIVPIGRWVMTSACDDVLALQRANGTYVSVNVSMRQLVDGAFAEWVESVLAHTGLPASALVVEVTESALMDDVRSIRSAFDRLRSRGVRVAIDDFGTGYSSLARLQELPVDLIKLDRAFVIDINVRPEARAMAAAILQLSAAIGATSVAEGVETEAEAATLLEIGYTTGQGFLFARPMSITDLTTRVRGNASGSHGRAA